MAPRPFEKLSRQPANEFTMNSAFRESDPLISIPAPVVIKQNIFNIRITSDEMINQVAGVALHRSLAVNHGIGVDQDSHGYPIGDFIRSQTRFSEPQFQKEEGIEVFSWLRSQMARIS